MRSEDAIYKKSTEAAFASLVLARPLDLCTFHLCAKYLTPVYRFCFGSTVIPTCHTMEEEIQLDLDLLQTVSYFLQTLFFSMSL